MRALREKIIVKLATDDQKKGAFVLPSKADGRAEVVAVGPKISPEELKVGDFVTIGPKREIVPRDDGTYWSMEIDNVVAVLS